MEQGRQRRLEQQRVVHHLVPGRLPRLEALAARSAVGRQTIST
jgi:hypothetical protein